MIIYGTRSTDLGTIRTENTTCESCGTKDSFSVTTFGKYFHFFWIPFFPIDTTHVGICSHCQKTYPKKRMFSPELWRNFETNPAFKKPIWHWIGPIIIGVWICMNLIVSAIAGQFSPDNNPSSQVIQAPVYRFERTEVALESDSLADYLKQCSGTSAITTNNMKEVEFFVRLDGEKLLIMMIQQGVKYIDPEQAVDMMGAVYLCIHDSKNLGEHLSKDSDKTYTILLKTNDQIHMDGQISEIGLLLKHYEDFKSIKQNEESVRSLW